MAKCGLRGPGRRGSRAPGYYDRMRIDPADEDFLFAKASKRVKELAQKARARRRQEDRAAFFDATVAKQKGKGW